MLRDFRNGPFENGEQLVTGRRRSQRLEPHGGCVWRLCACRPIGCFNLILRRSGFDAKPKTYRTTTSTDGVSALDGFKTTLPNLVILDSLILILPLVSILHGTRLS